MMKKVVFFLALCYAALPTTKAQLFQLSGYVKGMHSLYFMQHKMPLPSGDTTRFTYYNLFHNRLNFTLRPCKGLQWDVSMRNRFLDGALIRQLPQYADLLSRDDGLLDLSWNVIQDGGWLLNTSLDRFLLDYSWKNFQLKIGRQRINWGMGLVWNSNDIFNAFSYIDFDYEERPGSDAAAFTWYSSSTSSLDAVFKIDGANAVTLAARYLFNVRQYDLQFLAGLCENDMMTGIGWSGNIKNASFRGEASLFVPVLRGGQGAIALSGMVEADYCFPNSLYLLGSFLFNSMGTTRREGGISLLAMSSSLSAKRLSLGMFELFGQISYPLTPIINLAFSGIFNPADVSTYLSPSLTFSLLSDMELMLAGQALLGKTGSEYGATGNTYAAFVRLKWCFNKSAGKKEDVVL
jgi:hypothetical protein